MPFINFTEIMHQDLLDLLHLGEAVIKRVKMKGSDREKYNRVIQHVLNHGQGKDIWINMEWTPKGSRRNLAFIPTDHIMSIIQEHNQTVFQDELVRHLAIRDTLVLSPRECKEDYPKRFERISRYYSNEFERNWVQNLVIKEDTSPEGEGEDS